MLLPVVLNIENWRCLVIGGGAVAARKTKALLECSAQVHIISPELSDEITAVLPQVEYSQREFQSGDCNGFRMVFACTNSREVNAQIAREANEIGALCNIADDPRCSDFHTTSVLRRGPLTIAISSEGTSPVLSRHVKEQVENSVGEEYAQLISLMESQSIQNRGEAWKRVLASDVLQLLRDGKIVEAEKRLAALLK
jgi:precorrin-2 dehydrogenase/sirohydrochlorin ferrochelatase